MRRCRLQAGSDCFLQAVSQLSSALRCHGTMYVAARNSMPANCSFLESLYLESQPSAQLHLGTETGVNTGPVWTLLWPT